MRRFRIGPGPWTAAALVTIMLCRARSSLAQVKLEYKYPEGQKLTSQDDLQDFSGLETDGPAIETESKEERSIFSSTVGKKRADSMVPVEEKVESLRRSFRCQVAMVISYDSKDPQAKIDNPQLAFLVDLYKLVSQIAYTVVLDGQNKVKAIEGTEPLLEKANALNDLAKQSIRSRLDAQHLKTSLSNHTATCQTSWLVPENRGTNREARYWWRPDTDLPQEIRIRRQREAWKCHPREDQRQDDRRHVRDGSQFSFAAEGKQERPQGGVRHGHDSLRPRRRSCRHVER